VDVGGLYVTRGRTNVHPRWLNRVVGPGDEILVRVTESPRADRPKWKTVSSREAIRKHERAYYLRLKKKFEARPARGRA
jgi:protein involved in polysaccharide export with SLBB domain